MSGYAVLARFDGANVTSAELDRFERALSPRGPDGHAVWHRGRLGVASSVLCTGDERLDVCVASIDERLTVAGQVRIDARAELVDALTAAGCDVSPDDADVTLFAHAWNTWAERALARVLGDFSVLVHSAAEGRITLARDPLGVRMLFYAVDAERVVASNTLAAVLASPGVSRALDEDAIADFISVGMNENLGGTSFRDVRRVPPGHVVTVKHGGLSSTPYWSLPKVAERRLSSEDAYAEGFRNVLTASVRDRLRTSSVSVFMSGGLDSTSLAAVARQLLGPEGVHAVTVDLPTIAPSPDAHDASLVARALGIRHVILDGDPFHYGEGISSTLRAARTTVEPNSEGEGSVWQALLEAAAPSRVALYGEDPDTILAPPDLPDMLRASAPWRVALDVVGYMSSQRARPHLGVRDALRNRLRQWQSREQGGTSPPWLRADLRDRRAERARSQVPPAAHARPEVARRLAHPIWQSLLESLDPGTHGVPVDVRLPYLDLRVIEYALSAPPIPWAQHKALLRRAMRGLVPDEVRLRKKAGLAGVAEARAAQWWALGPKPFVPCAALEHFIDVRALPDISPSSDPSLLALHFQLRILDRWLRAREGGS